jgi:DNA-binding LacI/PurR family transcriptional regulator
VDGIVMIGGHINEVHVKDGYLNKLKWLTSEVPVVLVNGGIKDLDCYRIIPDEETGIRSMVNYLILCGHREIEFLGGVRGIQPTDSRMETVKKFLRQNHIEPVDDWFIEGGFDIKSGKELFDIFLQLDRRPTALVCFNDLIAIGVIYAAIHKGIVIPRDLSIVRFDNIYLAEYVTLAITSLDLKPAQLGKLAIEALITHLKDGYVRNETIVQTTLVIRDSCADREKLSV